MSEVAKRARLAVVVAAVSVVPVVTLWAVDPKTSADKLGALVLVPWLCGFGATWLLVKALENPSESLKRAGPPHPRELDLGGMFALLLTFVGLIGLTSAGVYWLIGFSRASALGALAAGGLVVSAVSGLWLRQLLFGISFRSAAIGMVAAAVARTPAKLAELFLAAVEEAPPRLH